MEVETPKLLNHEKKKHKRKERRGKEGREERRKILLPSFYGIAARGGGKLDKEVVCLLPREVENLLLVGMYICWFQQYVIDTTNSYVLLSTLHAQKIKMKDWLKLGKIAFILTLYLQSSF